MDDELPRDETALVAILREIELGKIQLYRNVLQQPYVSCDILDSPFVHLHLYDKDFRGWLTHYIWKTKKFLLRHREIDRILDEMAGRSLSKSLNKIQDPALLHFIESEPVVAVVLEFMHITKRHEGTMEALWKDLKRFAQSRGLLVTGKNRFPGGPNVLSRKLSILLPVLEQLSITIAVKRSNGCKVILSRRSDDSSEEPSAVSSAINSSTDQALSPKDDKAERILRLKQLKQQNDRRSSE